MLDHFVLFLLGPTSHYVTIYDLISPTSTVLLDEQSTLNIGLYNRWKTANENCRQCESAWLTLLERRISEHKDPLERSKTTTNILPTAGYWRIGMRRWTRTMKWSTAPLRCWPMFGLGWWSINDTQLHEAFQPHGIVGCNIMVYDPIDLPYLCQTFVLFWEHPRC